MAVDTLLTILTQIWKLGFTVKAALEKAGHNAEDCRRIAELLHKLDAVAKRLQGTPKLMEDASMRDATEGLEDALRRASELVAKCGGKSLLLRAWEAKNIGDKLREVCFDVLLELGAVLLANGVYTAAEIAHLRADVASTNAMLAKLLQIIVDRPDVHLPEEVAELVQAYRVSTESASSQIKNKRVTKKTDLARDSKAPHASLSDGSASVESVVRQSGSSTIISKIPRLSSSRARKLLEIYPLELRFPLESNKEAIICPVTLTNRMDLSVGVWIITPTNKRLTCPTRMIMEPRSTLVVPVTMKMHEQPPQDTGKFYVLMFVAQSKDDLAGFLNTNSDFTAQAEKLQIEVHWEELTAVTCQPASFQVITRSTKSITCTDVHPCKTWIVTGHLGGYVSIWNYHQQEETAMKWQITTTHSVCSTKFIAQENWLAAGDNDGYIYVYHYTADAKLYVRTKFRAYSNGDSVNLLAVHPIRTYVLSSSKCHSKILLWDWKDNWKKIREFNMNTDEVVCSLKFNLTATGSFPCVTFVNSAQVWRSTRSSTPIIRLEGTFRAHHFTSNHQLYLATLHSPRECTDGRRAPNSQIWDLERREVVHTLGVIGRHMIDVAHHPKLPILATTLDDGTVCLWDTRTWRLEKMIHITNSLPRNLKFYGDINGLTRLYVRFGSIMTILEINLPMASTSQRTGGRN